MCCGEEVRCVVVMREVCCGEEVRCLFKGGRGEEKVRVYGVGVEKIIVRWKEGRVGGGGASG